MVRGTDVPGVVLSPAGGGAPEHRVPVSVGGSGVSAVSLRRTLACLREERARRGLEALATVFKLDVAGHADPALAREVAALAGLEFDEVLVQAIWDAELEAGVAAIGRAQGVLDG